MTTTQRTVRVDDELWERFDAACSALGTNKSARIIQHIENDVEQLDVDNEGSKGA
jgi:predicted DNA-binding protein